MPKPKLPPQGGEKWLCLGMFLMLMFSVVMVVSAIYCIVIIYIPSMRELDSNIIREAKRCTTTQVERNITGTPEDGICLQSSCEEWCLSKGASPCSKVYGLLRDRGADMTWENCELEKEEYYLDHTCTTLEDLKPMNCKRSKWELDRPGSVEECRQFNNLISCEMGECKNVSLIYNCTYVNALDELKAIWGNEGFEVNGYCNCNECTTSNISLVKDVTLSQRQCPKDTRYCFEKGRNPDNYTEERKELCQEPRCQTCDDMCNDLLQCLSMHSRQDVAYFGVDMTKKPPESKLTYYNCVHGECTEVHSLKCRRNCDYKSFDFAKKNLVLFSEERVVMAKCKKAFINNSNHQLPEKSVVNASWTYMAATCSEIQIDPEMLTIYGSDCTNGTWLHDMGQTNYSYLTKVYAEMREDRDRFIKVWPSDHESLIPLEEDITIFNRTMILQNMEGCVNTLSLECQRFYRMYGKDGANYTSPVSYDCFYDPENPEFVVVDFSPDRTKLFLVFWTLLPFCVILFSCSYICVCSKLMYTGEDGHMRIFIMGRSVTGIGHVVVYKPPPKKEKPRRKTVEDEKNDPVAI